MHRQFPSNYHAGFYILINLVGLYLPLFTVLFHINVLLSLIFSVRVFLSASAFFFVSPFLASDCWNGCSRSL